MKKFWVFAISITLLGCVVEFPAGVLDKSTPSEGIQKNNIEVEPRPNPDHTRSPSPIPSPIPTPSQGSPVPIPSPTLTPTPTPTPTSTPTSTPVPTTSPSPIPTPSQGSPVPIPSPTVTASPSPIDSPTPTSTPSPTPTPTPTPTPVIQVNGSSTCRAVFTSVYGDGTTSNEWDFSFNKAVPAGGGKIEITNINNTAQHLWLTVPSLEIGNYIASSSTNAEIEFVDSNTWSTNEWNTSAAESASIVIDGQTEQYIWGTFNGHLGMVSATAGSASGEYIVLDGAFTCLL